MNTKGIKKLRTGIRGFDEVLHGGIPKGRVTLVTGNTGCGKTVFLNEFIQRGITEFNEPGVFVTFEEKPSQIAENISSFGWDYDKYVKQKKMAFVDFTATIKNVESNEKYDLKPLIIRIEHAIKKVGGKRLVIDSLGVLFTAFSNKNIIRQTILELSGILLKSGVTTLMSAEKYGGENDLSKYGVQEFVVDGVVDLATKAGQNKMLRTMIVRKMRGVGYRSGKVEFEILNDGLQVYPKITVDYTQTVTDFSVRKKTGVDNLDGALYGGIPQGHIVLVGGNTGTGKTTLALHFLKQGLDTKESCVWVGLEEVPDQIRKTALSYGINIGKFEKEGTFRFVNVSLIDVSPDRLLHETLDTINEISAKRVVFDSISSLFSSTMDVNKVREFLIQLAGSFKKVGVTSIMNYLVSDSFGANKDQLLSGTLTNEMRLGSIVDGIIILRYIERGQSVKRLLNILKMRGVQHSKDIFKYDIGESGFVLGEKYEI